MIEKKITETLLESGELSLGEGEASAMTLPEHSTTITIELDGESFGAQWNGRSRNLRGDVLTERLMDYGEIDGLLRLRQVGDIYRLELLPPGRPPRLPIPAPAPRPTPLPDKEVQRQRRATVDRQYHADSEYDWGNRQEKKIGFLTEARSLLREQLAAAGFDSLELLELRLEGEEIATLDDFEELMAVDLANVDRMPHQEAAARHALSRMKGRAILADEVGLGKTIEAGLAMKELTLRGLAKSVLIVCPAMLRDQWRDEMLNKFEMSFDVARRGPEVGNQERLILSLQLGTMNADLLSTRPWDIVIVDEAHRAAGGGALKRREFITALTMTCRYAFFLTATPVQNNLLELYRIVELLRPGTFSSKRAFERQFVTRTDPRTPNDPAGLRRLISNVMIRTTRAQAGVDRVVRRASDVPVDLGPKERELYVLSTDLLRNVMNGPGDSMRRRNLALRLTDSPFSMGTTAMAIAQKHPDARVRAVLNELAHLAMDIEGSARENRAVEITQDWVREHGRVLIFSKHTDTVTSLLRRLGQEGLPARAFHSSMSASEQSKTINAFRAGDAPVMISTDAGAEGQNLQFCNCVLNYDLPWNPMKIEQRIGRVDRLTQPRDEVFIANLYARNTIDEGVYRLLAEKLRMFELLFGQVTTILGELDESKSLTFESRVLEALFAEDDARMQSLLNQLGTELVSARERAATLIAADKGLSEWMVGALDHRKEIPEEGASELLPQVSERTRIRQRRVQAWVRRTLQALGAEILHDTGEEDGAFITAEFAPDFKAELGGRTVLHLAFDRKGLDQHPEAELCAIGSPVFDELLALLRMRGDLYATVPDIPEDLGPSPIKHCGQISLISRRLISAGSWHGRAAFRAAVGEAETTEHIITAVVETSHQARLPRRLLRDGEKLPEVFADTSRVIREFERAAAAQLESLRLDRENRIVDEQATELKRISSNYQSQIRDAPFDDRQRLERARDSERRRLSRRPDVRARAKMLALVLDEDDWVVEETWSRSDGIGTTLTYEWDPNPAPRLASAASGIPIEVLTLCSTAHVVDQSEVSRCASCDRDLCGACGSAALMRPCPLCDLSVCGNCRTETGGLCLRCASPERVIEWDQEHARGWRLNGGNKLLVGQRVAQLVRPDGSPPVLLIPSQDSEDESRAKVRGYAVANGLPADAGLIMHDRTARGALEDPARLCLASSETVSVELSVEPGGGSDIDCSIIADVPECPLVSVISEGELNLELLFKRLRDVAPPPAPPAVVITRRAHFDEIYLASEQLAQEIMQINDSGAVETVETRYSPLEWLEPMDRDATLAHATLGGVSVFVSRRNDAILVRAEGTRLDGPAEWIGCPPGLSPTSQLGYFDLLCTLGKPGGRVGQRLGEVTSLLGEFPAPSECRVTERVISPIAVLKDTESQAGLVPAGEGALRALGISERAAGIENIPPIPYELNRMLLEKSERDFTTIAMTGFKVSEWWQGHGAAKNVYEAFDGQPSPPELDDFAGTAADFGVCRAGHFYQAGTAACCDSCRTWACRACDEIEHHASMACSACGSLVCRRCLVTPHDKVPDSRCVNCQAQACADCGVDPNVVACAMCARPMCEGCRSDDICGACDRLSVASEMQSDMLPEELAIAGATVWVGVDNDAMVAYINRGEKAERAILRDGSVADWTAFGIVEITRRYGLRLAASRAFSAQVVPVEEVFESDTDSDVPHVTIDAERTFRVAWSAPSLGVAGVSKSIYPNFDDDPLSAVAEEFPPLQAIPRPEPVVPTRVQQLLASVASPDAHVLNVRWSPEFREIELVDSGILTRTLLGDDVSEVTATWGETSGALGWVTGQWSPVPDVLLHVHTEDAEAAVVKIGLLLALGIRHQDETRWFEIARSDDAPAATALSRWLGLGDADHVGTFTDPSSLRFSSIMNGTRTVEVKAVGAVTAGARRGGADKSSALRAWLPEAQILVPALTPLSGQLRAQLERRARGHDPRITLEIGVQIKESVTLADGKVLIRETKLTPGNIDARRRDEVTGNLLDEGILDREGHFTRGISRCRYCRSWICSNCIDGLTSCDCCGDAICKRCVTEPRPQLWLCLACAEIRLPTRREARRHGRLISKRGMLIGSDDFHTVVVEHLKNRWERQQDGARKKPIASPAVRAFLNSRLAIRGS